MNLAIDIGNSNIKIGCFRNSNLEGPVQNVQKKDLEGVISEIDPQRIIVSSVVRNTDIDLDQLKRKYGIVILDHKTPLPFRLNYETPETLGVDRIAAAAGAQVVNSGRTSMIIDMGTCITYDMLENGEVFSGGIISPGMRIRFKAMHDYTGNLPHIEQLDNWNESIIGKTTVTAMKSGVINGIKCEIESFIQLYNELFPGLKVLMCGGEAKIFESKLKAPIFAVPDLVLIGLNRILDYNA